MTTWDAPDDHDVHARPDWAPQFDRWNGLLMLVAVAGFAVLIGVCLHGRL